MPSNNFINIWNYNICKWTTTIKNIKIPNSVTVIGTRVFEKCYSLKNISIPNSVKEIKKYAFYDCRSLANINIPNSTHTHTELHEMMAAPSFHFRSVL